MRDPTEGDREPPPRSPDEPPAGRDWPEPADSNDRPPATGGLGGFAADSGLVYRRVGAYVIDSLLVALTTTVLGVATGVISMDFEAPAIDPSLALWMLIFEVLYRWSMQSAFGATLGKLALGLRLVAADGSPAGPLQILVREIALGVMLGVAQATGWAILPALVQVLLVYVVIHRPDRRSLHDLTVQTRVIRVRPGDSDTPMRAA
ncbi:MAG: RDD family protein [Chloroflexota bacterium]|nr:RDD family protein [Chloroflexota bacterium]MDE2919267.1 RDD family protein [Chloroflexota bacterium]